MRKLTLIEVPRMSWQLPRDPYKVFRIEYCGLGVSGEQ